MIAPATPRRASPPIAARRGGAGRRRPLHIGRTAPGIALPTVVYFLAVLGLMISGSFYLVLGARRSSSALADDALLIGAADAAVARTVASWEGERRADQPIGATTVDSMRLATQPLVDDVVTVVRLSPVLYWVAAGATHVRRTTRRRVALLARFEGSPPPAVAAVIARGDVILGPGARLLADSAGTIDAGCVDEGAEEAPMIVVGDSASVRLDAGRPSTDSVSWSRAAWADDPVVYEPFGKDSWSSTRARARVSFGAGATVRLEEGTGVAYAAGDVDVAGGAWRGILLVEGRLRVSGPLSFEGIVIARGGVAIDADGVEIRGLLMSAGSSGADSAAERGSVVLRRMVIVRRSWCAVQRAFAASASIRPVRERSWLELLEAR